MTKIGLSALLLASGLALSACQTSQSRKDELASLCSVPINRQPGSAYFDECQSLYPRTNQQLQKDFLLGAPTAD